MSQETSTNDLNYLLQSRRSIRRFKDQPIPRSLVEGLIESATYAPSAHNRQPWRFIILTSKDQRAALAEAMGEDFQKSLLDEGLSLEQSREKVKRSHDRITNAPIAILLCLDTTTLDEYKDPIRQQGEHTLAAQSVAMAGAYLLLAAHAEGLGAVWLSAPLFTPKTVQGTLNLPASWLAQGMILLGYPKDIPPPRSRKQPQDITFYP